MNFIYMKRMSKGFKKFTNWLAYRIFLHDLKTTSPDFNMLWQFADFIKMLEIASWYDNAKHNVAFSSKDYNNGENGFIINKENEKLKVIFKLTEKNNNIALSIIRDYGHKRSNDLSFKNKEIEMEHGVDELLMLHVIDITTEVMIILLEEYYKKG